MKAKNVLRAAFAVGGVALAAFAGTTAAKKIKKENEPEPLAADDIPEFEDAGDDDFTVEYIYDEDELQKEEAAEEKEAEEKSEEEKAEEPAPAEEE